ncbi:hypothetical protein EVAR_36180_1 [Eumeta japonica]|uniref:Uncharacterized protein n=1 Tax=Eumeta variegata TaxID=151549 RepID=A0A4C1VUA2_EUMVA|nr:hypothetical protein EVAR_36180_1 [Eumeta japonica]
MSGSGENRKSVVSNERGDSKLKPLPSKKNSQSVHTYLTSNPNKNDKSTDRRLRNSVMCKGHRALFTFSPFVNLTAPKSFKLTYEEFATVLVQIEAILNSRPLYTLSTYPNDLMPLTPAHFLIGRPLASPASDDLTSEPMNRLTRYERIAELRQHFWQ